MTMHTIQIQLPDSLYKQIRTAAEHDGISLDQFLVTAAAEKLAALQTIDYLRQRAARSSQTTFEEALSEIPDVEPEEYDKL